MDEDDRCRVSYTILDFGGIADRALWRVICGNGDLDQYHTDFGVGMAVTLRTVGFGGGILLKYHNSICKP
jgi:hypothetical protein